MDIKTEMNLIKSVIDGDGDFKKSLKKFKELQKKSKKVKKQLDLYQLSDVNYIVS